MYQGSGLFVHCKDTNLKAIHNPIQSLLHGVGLFVHCKDTNLKAIHNFTSNALYPASSCSCTAKILI